MQRREKILLIVLAAGLVVWWGLPMAQSALFGSLQESETQLKSLQAELTEKENEQLTILRATGDLKNYREASLPGDALDAQRLYLDWLTDLALMSGIREPDVTPGRRMAQGDVYTAVQVEVKGEAALEQLTQFLHRFHRANLTHRIVQMSIARQSEEEGDKLEVTLLAEGLSLSDAADRPWLFPNTILAEDASSNANELVVADGAKLAEPPFRIRLGDEYALVSAVDQNRLTVERGVDATTPASHSAGAVVELAPVRPSLADQSLDDYETLLAENPFGPYQEQRVEGPAPEFASASPPRAYYGKELRFVVSAQPPEGAAAELEYELTRAPEGASIDADTGEVRWTPSSDAQPGEHTFVVQAGGEGLSSASKTVEVELEEDMAQFTYFTASITWDETPQAWLYDRANNRRIVLREGAPFDVASVSGKVLEIGADFMLLETSGAKYRLALGENLRSLTPAPETAGGEAEEAAESAAVEGESTVSTATESLPIQ